MALFSRALQEHPAPAATVTADATLRDSSGQMISSTPEARVARCAAFVRPSATGGHGNILATLMSGACMVSMPTPPFARADSALQYRIAGLSSNSLNPPSHHTWSPSLLPPFEPHLSRLAYSDLLTPIEAVTGQTHELLPPMFDIASIAPLVFDPASVEPPSPHGPSAASTRYPSSLPVGKRPAYTSPTVAARKKMKPSPPSPSVRSTASYTLASDPSLALSPFPRLLTDAELVPATHPWQGYSPVKADDTRSDFGVTSSSDRPERLAPPRSKRSKVLPLGAAASNVRSSVSDCAGTDRADTPVSQARFSSVSQVTNCTLDATPSTDKAVTIAVENLARATSGLLEG